MGFASKFEIGGSQYSIASSLYGTCTTSSGTPSKIVTCPDFDTLIIGTTIAVKFVYTNTAANPTLNVNGTGALPIYTDGTSAPGVTPQDSWAANSVVTFTYDGSAWLMTDAMGTALNALRAQMLNMIYPVGSIYMSASSTDPGTLFGGTWEQIKDRFLLSAGDTYANGETGGAETVTLTEDNLPSHNHSIPALSGTAATNGSHYHDMLYITPSGSISGNPWEWNSGKGNYTSGQANAAMSYAGSHTHSVTTNASTTGNKGSGTAVNKMPPYLAVYVWQRTE